MKRNIKEIVEAMTLEEKAGLCSGGDFWHTKEVKRLGIPKIMLSDGPHGLRKQEEEGDHLGVNESIEAVCFPAACATASSFDVELMEEMGKTLGNECQAEGVDILLGPAVNIKRSPLCGRNFEYMSEDPYLTGEMAAAYIKGVQSKHIGTSMKHFAANNQEYQRMVCSSEVDEQTLREIYFPAFEIAVKKAQPKTIMCSYNKINGEYASDNEWLLNKVLRDDWGFEGFVVTDWGAVNNRVQGLSAGLDLEMPSSGGVNDERIVDAVKKGTLDEKKLDQAVERILKTVFECADHRDKEAVFDRALDHEKAVDIETECAVLLENNGVLPLNENKKVAYIGGFAKNPRYQGGGSSHIHSSKESSALESAKNKNRNITYAKGFTEIEDVIDEKEVQLAVDIAKEADVAVVFAGLPEVIEGEGYDRKDMKLPECQNHLINEIIKVQPNTVVVLHNGSPVECPWANQVAAILELYLGGEGVGEACDRILWGEANPCGRLAETFPLKLEDNPSYLYFKGDGKKVKYQEGIFVGYRYYDTKKQQVRWPFGHGLSYTKFSYHNLRVSKKQMQDDDVINVFVDVKNIGQRTGKEVVQLYISDRTTSFGRPMKELKGFKKIELKPEEEKTLEFQITARDLSYFNEAMKDWYAASGTYGILIGHSSRDICLEEEILFETKRLLPMTIDGTTTLGELMNDPRTAPVLGQIMAQAFGASEENSNAGLESDDATARATMNAMPLKSLASFAAMPENVYENMLLTLQDVVKSK
ncbi:MAG: glycoside hydrolase family 3 C-terminal domain-containing protein [Lachnospiraceae bacterium]|nr:glycoside hydrolase family 3 C-terminal domain-containing protein [Lachnospiraceae bacterium]